MRFFLFFFSSLALLGVEQEFPSWNLIVSEVDAILDNSHFCEKETQSVQEAVSSVVTICREISFLRESGYMEKKGELILNALKALNYSKKYSAKTLAKIGNPAREGRAFSRGIGVYKKNRDVKTEALVWELSFFLDCDQWIAPSLPLFIHGDLATFQPYCEISSTRRFISIDQKLPVSMLLEDFWILSLFNFLVGQSDLNGDNLHYDASHCLFLDNDCSFPSTNIPYSKDGGYLFVPLQNSLIDFLDASLPLSWISYVRVKATLERWSQREEEIRKFFLLSPLVQSRDFQLREAAFWERWERLFRADLQEGVSLRDFVRGIFPEHFKQIEVAQQLASEILGYCPGPMSSLHLLGSFFPYVRVNRFIAERVYEWKQCNHLQDCS